MDVQVLEAELIVRLSDGRIVSAPLARLLVSRTDTSEMREAGIKTF